MSDFDSPAQDESFFDELGRIVAIELCWLINFKRMIWSHEVFVGEIFPNFQHLFAASYFEQIKAGYEAHYF